MAGHGLPVEPFADIIVACALDDSGIDGIGRAALVARANGARLAALTVGDRAADLDRLARFAGIGRDEIEAGLRADLRAELARLVERAGVDMPVDLRVRIGRPFREIVADVIAGDRDLVIKMAEPFDGARRYLFTSTDQHLIRKCPCPVWLAMPGSSHPPAAILAAVDLDDEDGEGPAAQDALNREIVETAMRVAAVCGAVLHVTHVWEAPAEDLVRRWSNDAGDVRRYTAAIEDRRRRALDALIAAVRAELAGLADIRIVPHLARGRPRAVIPAHIEAMGIDLLVIGTLARAGVPGLIIGNTAEDVLNAVDCSVLTVKPPGYVSPLAAAGP